LKKKPYTAGLVLIALAILAASCGTAISETPAVTQPAEMVEMEATETPEYRWDQLLSRDSILPIYEPEMVPGDEVSYEDDELVMGIAIDGEAKAYLVSVLNSREMVNDELAGIPILVSW
jgi:hypothetical protein